MDMLIGSVSQAALNHIGLLVVEEIQNVCNSKHCKSIVGMLTSLLLKMAIQNAYPWVLTFLNEIFQFSTVVDLNGRATNPCTRRYRICIAAIIPVYNICSSRIKLLYGISIVLFHTTSPHFSRPQ